jgi:hypothetical protein
MKKLIILILFLTCISHLSFSQTPTYPPERYVGWFASGSFNSIQKTSDGGVIGITNNQTNKYSEAGVLQFSLPFAPKTLLPTSDGGYIMGVNTNAAQTSLTNYYGGYDTWIVKVNTSGVIQWQQSLSGTGDDNLESMKLTSNGDLIVLLSSNSTTNFGVGNQGGKDLWLVHLSTIGTLTKINLGGSADETFKNLETLSSTESLVCLTTTSQNGVFSQGFKGGIDTWVLKITKGVSLTITQKRAYGGSADDEGSLSISNSKYLITGYSKSSNGDLSINKGLKDLWICFINPDGTLISSDNYGGTGDDLARDAYFNTVDNAFYILGDCGSADGDFPNPSSGLVHDRLFKFSNTGVFGWRRDFYVSRPFGVACSLRKFENESGVYISGLLNQLETNRGTNLFTADLVVGQLSSGISTFFCKLGYNNGSTLWFRQPNFGFRDANISLLEKLSDGNFLCATLSRFSTSGSSKIFTINSQGNDVRTNFNYNSCPIYTGQNTPPCYPPYLSATSNNNGIFYVKYDTQGPIRKVCPQVYAGITRQYKLYCNTTISDTIQVPNDNEFTYQWKRNGTPISGATLPKYLATQTGKYTVEISGKTCTGKAETDTIVLALATNEVVTPKLKAITDSTVCLGDTVKMTIFDGCNYGFLQWQKDGIDISGETSLTYQTTQSGIYRVKVTTNGSATYTKSKTVTINPNCCIMKSLTNGNWESPSTWSCQRVPNETDDVIINGHQINVTTNSAKAKKVIYKGGKIIFSNNTSKVFIKNN